MSKIVENEYVVGILTKTNQFVGIETPHPYDNATDTIQISDINDKIWNHTEYDKVDSDTLLNNNIDTERETVIKKIKLETNFYSAFRNTVRNVLNKLEHYDVKQKIKNIIHSHDLFKIKLAEISTIIKKFITPYIEFVEFDDYTIDLFSEIGLCVDHNKDDLDTAYCFSNTKSGITQLKLPKIHLISGVDNEEIYFGRISDDLIRYNRIRKYILEDNVFLNLTELPFNLHDNEIILPESLIMNEYFTNIKESKSNYEMKNTYDTLIF